MYQKIGIVGLGLIGGSIAKVCRNRLGVKEIVAYNRNLDVLEAAYQDGVIDFFATEITDIFSDCDVVFLCTPVDKIFPFAQKLIPFLKETTIVTDVGSTKGHLYDQLKQCRDSFYYIGGHPMTGSEKFRYQASKEHLFENAYYILTPAEWVPNTVITQFQQFIASFGAIPVTVSAYEHDHIVASISHVPQIVASALCNFVQKADDSQHHMKLLAAGGFKDITRIASSSADMWRSICFENKKEILNALTSLEETIAQLKLDLTKNDTQEVYHYFENAKNYRDSFATLTPKGFLRQYEIIVDVLDKPGSIAIIAVLFSSNNINIKNLSILNNRERENGVLLVSFESEEQRQKSVALLREMNYEVQLKD